MQFTKNSYEKMSELSAIPQQSLLAIGVPDIKFYQTSRGLQALCPFHNDHKLGSFIFNPTTGVWKCFSCGVGGSGAISFIMKVNNWDFLKAVYYLYDHRNEITLPPELLVPPLLVKTQKEKNHIGEMPKISANKSLFVSHGPVTRQDCHLIYLAFADASPLTEDEKRKLMQVRKISYGETGDFFRIPAAWDDQFWTNFKERLNAIDDCGEKDRLYHSLIGVPGFFWDDEHDRPGFVYFRNSLGILLHSLDGLICGIDMRLPADAPQGARYIAFSSAGICDRNPNRFSMGTRTDVFVDVVPCHFGGSKEYKGVAITEGKFKAIQLSRRGYTALNVRGVVNWKHALPYLEKMPTDKPVTIVFDADCRSNPAVGKQAADLGRALMEAGYEAQYLTWNSNLGKGFDDLCNGGHYNKVRLVPAQRFLDTTLDPFLQRAASRKEYEASQKLPQEQK